ncbi:MAG: 30S ribosomal protein S3ae [Candidatus Heimdallarchaeota archaeon]|nr:30S ribosomal protein S3ae [Candidatus Heimdallarchaeota archaeon]
MSQRRSSGRRRRKSADSGAEKWKNKIWLNVKTPDYIDEKSLGETPTSNTDTAIGRTIKTTLMDLTGSFKDLNYQLTFKISEINGTQAKTEFYEHELSRDFRRSQIRNHRSQIEGIFNLKLTDGAKIRVKMFVVTPMRAHSSVKKAIRETMEKRLLELATELSFPAFVNKLISYELRDELIPLVEAIYPIKLLEVSKVKVLRYPGGVSPHLSAA